MLSFMIPALLTVDFFYECSSITPLSQFILSLIIKVVLMIVMHDALSLFAPILPPTLIVAQLVSQPPAASNQQPIPTVAQHSVLPITAMNKAVTCF